MAIQLIVNGKTQTVEAAADTPLLWVLRDYLGLKGTKFGCGLGICGACTIHLNGKAVRACTTALAEIKGQRIVTIEGLAAGSRHPVQQAWLEEEVAQCGYCQAGQIMSAAALLASNPN